MSARYPFRRAVTIAAVFAAPPLGCTFAQTPSVERRLCERFDTCNLLVGGIDVNDCADVLVMCTEQLVSSLRNDWTRSAEGALEYVNCDNFVEAFAEIDVCQVSDVNCEDGDRFECVAEHRIVGCIEGASFDMDCHDLCEADGLGSVGCGFSADRGHDVCNCGEGAADDTGGGPPPADTGTASSSAGETTTAGPGPAFGSSTGGMSEGTTEMTGPPPFGTSTGGAGEGTTEVTGPPPFGTSSGGVEEGTTVDVPPDAEGPGSIGSESTTTGPISGGASIGVDEGGPVPPG